MRRRGCAATVSISGPSIPRAERPMTICPAMYGASATSTAPSRRRISSTLSMIASTPAWSRSACATSSLRSSARVALGEVAADPVELGLRGGRRRAVILRRRRSRGRTARAALAPTRVDRAARQATGTPPSLHGGRSNRDRCRRPANAAATCSARSPPSSAPSGGRLSAAARRAVGVRRSSRGRGPAITSVGKRRLVERLGERARRPERPGPRSWPCAIAVGDRHRRRRPPRRTLISVPTSARR